ncbi:hypothetical protein BJ138DRAFT_1130270 [Hygrophoropsis aurantiaca]|uniref:Uncharacterized protein n=1 Tax=Hygrophoropsis aurantiaca TaxID=72124 RepID=A0ACB7ZXL7_9AGAM|nr:hypothetical protein BJ138DRAFT_1130270 [Hygrophoropsis aurantiaca]
MERIKEYWDRNSVTTVFRISHKDGRPVGCEVNKARVFTNACGLGWKFGIAYDSNSPEIDIFFRFTEENWTEAYYGTSVSLFIALLEDINGDAKAMNARRLVTIPTKSKNERNSWYPRDIIARPYILFKVTLSPGIDVHSMMKKKYPPLKPALTPAIQTVLHRGLFSGTFYFDTKFLARSGCASSCPMEPIYAHSTVITTTQPALLQYNAPFDISIDKYESDSDYDETEVNDERDSGADAMIVESPPHNNPSPSSTLREPPSAYHATQPAGVRTIQMNGIALKTLKALIYHCYTSEIFFRPLRSAPADTSKDRPLPLDDPDRIYCSPKSMYRLADKIGADELKSLSLESIRSSLSKHNILDEVFSPFTSRYPEVLDTELALLGENAHEPEVVQALPGKIRAVASGALPHSYEVLFSVMQRVR